MRGFSKKQIAGTQVEGRNAVIEALRGKRKVSKILIAKGIKPGKSLGEIIKLAAKKDIKLVYTERTRLEDLAISQVHQGVIAYVEPIIFLTLKELLSLLDKKKRTPFLLILDGVTDPQNFGSLIRTAEAAGVDAVIIGKRRTATVTPTVIKASAGAIEHIPLVQVGNIASVVEGLKDSGIWVIGSSDRAKVSLYEADLTGSMALVLGSEGKGISRLVSERCDLVVRIPMQGKVSSLNVGVAGAVLMFEVRRQRGQNEKS